jgi:hypothetical protein
MCIEMSTFLGCDSVSVGWFLCFEITVSILKVKQMTSYLPLVFIVLDCRTEYKFSLLSNSPEVGDF